MSDYTPKIIELAGTNFIHLNNPTMAYGQMLVNLEKCPLCSTWMIGYIGDSHKQDVFPKFFAVTFYAQIKSAGWRLRTRTHGKHKYICRKCKQDERAFFECYSCAIKQSASEIQESCGARGLEDYLCKSCYSTLPAKRWDELLEELAGEHRWDYE